LINVRIGYTSGSASNHRFGFAIVAVANRSSWLDRSGRVASIAMLQELVPGSVADEVARLIPVDVPARPRAVAVMDGVLSGRVWTDDAAHPGATIVLEDADGTVYAGGAVTKASFAQTLEGVETASRDLIFGFAGSDDPTRSLVPVAPYWRGDAIDFSDRQPPADEAASLAVVTGARVVEIDAALLPQTAWYEDTLHAFGSVDGWLTHGVGFGVMVGNRLVAEAIAGPRTRGLLEMGVATREEHRGRGYGTLVSRLVARACEVRGDRVWWNAHADNAPSVAIARRLGFRRERHYELFACRAPLIRTR
jgi:GNAT superfamily N-acetyltransferase